MTEARAQEKASHRASWLPVFLMVRPSSILFVTFVLFVVNVPCILESGQRYWQSFPTNVAL